MQLVIDDRVHLSEFRLPDKAALVEHLNDRDIYERTLRIPFPYTEAAADDWLAHVSQEQGRPLNWAIRTGDGALIGGCGFDGAGAGAAHRVEIGYWLAREYRGRGIMSAVVGRLCRHAFDDLGLLKITAHVFLHNPASARVLEKCGFRQEGLLRKHFLKDGTFLDARLFALLR